MIVHEEGRNDEEDIPLELPVPVTTATYEGQIGGSWKGESTKNNGKKSHSEGTLGGHGTSSTTDGEDDSKVESDKNKRDEDKEVETHTTLVKMPRASLCRTRGAKKSKSLLNKII